ncbi:hypothetical protein T4B_4848 [Trichinella pseudospiralis]|uniref:Uncharacterized protein n=1 Tax=Trichinella pseudospiralis TaxID=6337 RepID=A0A0V1J0M5_TRIPS|nr:hypothetical protein T4B_4848 [Trichinella pseudospiralis]
MFYSRSSSSGPAIFVEKENFRYFRNFVNYRLGCFAVFPEKIFFQFFCIFCYKSLNDNRIDGFGVFRRKRTGTHGINGLSQFWRFTEEFIEIPKPFAIFLSIRKINFSSFSAHFD